MDSRLQERLGKWHKQIDTVKDIKDQYFAYEATEKSLESDLFLVAEGSSIQERMSKVHSSSEWKDFKKKHAELKTEYNKERRMLELKIKAFEACYLTYKLEYDAIKKHP